MPVVVDGPGRVRARDVDVHRRAVVAGAARLGAVDRHGGCAVSQVHVQGPEADEPRSGGRDVSVRQIQA